jgi:hypothetical protein
MKLHIYKNLVHDRFELGLIIGNKIVGVFCQGFTATYDSIGLGNLKCL